MVGASHGASSDASVGLLARSGPDGLLSFPVSPGAHRRGEPRRPALHEGTSALGLIGVLEGVEHRLERGISRRVDPRLVGYSRALDLLMSARVLVGKEASQIGLVCQARSPSWSSVRIASPSSR